MITLSSEILEFIEGIPYATIILSDGGKVLGHNKQMEELAGQRISGQKFNRWELFQFLQPDHLEIALTSSGSIPVRLSVSGKSISADMKSFTLQSIGRLLMITVPSNGGLLGMFQKLDTALKSQFQNP